MLGVKMLQESRLFKILYYLLNYGKATASELAEMFEVSIRTIYRDIDALAARESLFMLTMAGKEEQLGV